MTENLMTHCKVALSNLIQSDHLQKSVISYQDFADRIIKAIKVIKVTKVTNIKDHVAAVPCA